MRRNNSPESEPLVLVCGNEHPTAADALCDLHPGTNGRTEDNRDVHVHRGQNDDGVHRWESAT